MNIRKLLSGLTGVTAMCIRSIPSKMQMPLLPTRTMTSVLHPVADSEIMQIPKHKISVIGVGSVGMAIAFSIMHSGIADELALVDIQKGLLEGEVMDLQHCQLFMRRCDIRADTDYAVTANSQIVVVTAGARQMEGESRLNLVQRNVNLYKKIIPEVVKNSPNCILLIVSNPVDIMTYVAWKLSKFTSNKIFGSGTMLDTARFRFFLGEKLGISPECCHGYIIGEHGDSSVAVWSTVNVAGVPLSLHRPNIGTVDDTEKFGDLHKDVISSAGEIIKRKGYTSWAVGVTVGSLCETIITDKYSVLPLSIYAKNIQSIKHEVFLSLPCVVSAQGITHVVPQSLKPTEQDQLLASAQTLNDVQTNIQW